MFITAGFDAHVNRTFGSLGCYGNNNIFYYAYKVIDLLLTLSGVFY